MGLFGFGKKKTAAPAPAPAPRPKVTVSQLPVQQLHQWLDEQLAEVPGNICAMTFLYEGDWGTTQLWFCGDEGFDLENQAFLNVVDCQSEGAFKWEEDPDLDDDVLKESLLGAFRDYLETGKHAQVLRGMTAVALEDAYGELSFIVRPDTRG